MLHPFNFQDIFHAIKGILDACKKKHPGFAAFARALGDAFLVPFREDIDAAKLRMRVSGLTEDQIAQEERFNWKRTFLKTARRGTGPSREHQLARFLAVWGVFKTSKNPVDDELLLRPRAIRKMEAAALRIAAGYYFDSDQVDLFKYLGKTTDGAPRWQNTRGVACCRMLLLCPRANSDVCLCVCVCVCVCQVPMPSKDFIKS